MDEADDRPVDDGSGQSSAGESVDGSDDFGDLSESLVALSQLSSARLSLEDLLREVASFAVQAIPGADGAGLTLFEADRSDTVVKSAEFVVAVDDIQYGIGEGPCVTAAADRQVVRSGSLGGDPRWPRFGPRVGRLGVHSALSLPLTSGDRMVGAMNIYAHARDAFDERAERIGALFAVPAAIAVQNAQVLAQTRRLAAHLEQAMANRSIIDQAVGILISRGAGTAQQAFERIRVMSQHQHLKVAAVAADIVREAANRARRRSTDQR